MMPFMEDYTMATLRRAQTEIKMLRKRITLAMNNIGPPQTGYPASLAYAYEALRGDHDE